MNGMPLHKKHTSCQEERSGRHHITERNTISRGHRRYQTSVKPSTKAEVFRYLAIIICGPWEVETPSVVHGSGLMAPSYRWLRSRAEQWHLSTRSSAHPVARLCDNQRSAGRKLHDHLAAAFENEESAMPSTGQMCYEA